MVKKTIINNRWSLNLPEIRVKALPWSIWEKERLDAMYKTIRKGDVILDIGTEFGDLSALYSQWCGGKMILIEPSENYWPYIKKIFEDNNCPEPIGSFVGFVGEKNTIKTGKPLNAGYPKEVNGKFTVEGDSGFGFRHLDEQASVIPVITIDEIACSYTKIDIINIDIEGSEYRAILGATETIKKYKPIFLISIHPAFMVNRYKDTTDDLIMHMELNGYETTFLAQDHEQHYMFRPK